MKDNLIKELTKEELKETFGGNNTPQYKWVYVDGQLKRILIFPKQN